MAHLLGDGLFLIVQSGTGLSLQGHERSQQNGCREEILAVHTHPQYRKPKLLADAPYVAVLAARCGERA